MIFGSGNKYRWMAYLSLSGGDLTSRPAQDQNERTRVGIDVNNASRSRFSPAGWVNEPDVCASSLQSSSSQLSLSPGAGAEGGRVRAR